MLIQARKNAALESIYSAYARRLIRKQFGNVRLSGIALPETDLPVIAYMNHSAWWDAVVPVHLSHDLFRREIHALMEGEQIKKYPFFRHLGCFGPTESGIADARAVVQHSVSVLRQGRRPILWICPQGAIYPSRAPMRFKSGLARIAQEVPEAIVIPVAIRYEFLKQERPACFVRTGEPVVRSEESNPQLTRRLETILDRELAALDSEVARELK
jgi:1-acyl-sn-glycerol-3-phosphate acyltransferase